MPKENVIAELKDELKRAYQDLQNALSRVDALTKRISDELNENDVNTESENVEGSSKKNVLFAESGLFRVAIDVGELLEARRHFIDMGGMSDVIQRSTGQYISTADEFGERTVVSAADIERNLSDLNQEG